MSFLTICQDVRRECSISGVGPTAVTSQTGEMARIVNWVIQSNDEIQQKFPDWRFLWSTNTIATVASTSVYTGESDLRIWDRDRFRIGTTGLDVIDYADYIDDGATTSGQPSEVIVRPDGQIILWPTPDAVYTVSYDYYKFPTLLAADGDEPLSLGHKSRQLMDRLILGSAMMKYAAYESAEEVMVAGRNYYDTAYAQLWASESPKGEGTTLADGNEIVVECW